MQRRCYASNGSRTASSWTGSAFDAAAIVAVFKPAAGGGEPPVAPTLRTVRGALRW